MLKENLISTMTFAILLGPYVFVSNPLYYTQRNFCFLC